MADLVKAVAIFFRRRATPAFAARCSELRVCDGGNTICGRRRSRVHPSGGRRMMRATIVQDPIDVPASARGRIAIHAERPHCFLALSVRRTMVARWTGSSISAYEEMAEREMMAISVRPQRNSSFGRASRASNRRARGRRRPSPSWLPIRTAHAMDALRYVVDETKARATIWKLEHYADGSREWVGAGTGQRDDR